MKRGMWIALGVGIGTAIGAGMWMSVSDRQRPGTLGSCGVPVARVRQG